MDARTRLPNRRPSLGTEIVWPPESGSRWLIQVSFDHRNTVREIFGDGPKSGTQMHAIIDDACILASIALQFGADLQQLAHAVSREASDPGAPSASIVGAVIEAAARLERHVLTGEGGAGEGDGAQGEEHAGIEMLARKMLAQRMPAPAVPPRKTKRKARKRDDGRRASRRKSEP